MRESSEFLKFASVLWLQAATFFLAIFPPVFFVGRLTSHPAKPMPGISDFIFWSTIFFLAGTLAAGITLLIFLNDAKLRKGDKYKFRRTQVRTFAFSKIPELSRIETVLTQLHYFIEKAEQFMDGRVNIRAKRGGVVSRDPLTFREKTPWKLTDTIVEIYINSDGSAQISATPEKWFVYGDYNHTRYFLLEELVDALGWSKDCEERATRVVSTTAER